MRETIVIQDTCRCGATFEVRAPRALIASGRHDVWLEAHAVCRERPTMPLPGKHPDTLRTQPYRPAREPNT